ncbi:MAG: winged helix-turn-helix transcriptional regulator [Chloroflexi bacterium]|nr:winged helix-turn-helix transcriptional regulator [Chloroflexota bacterium]
MAVEASDAKLFRDLGHPIRLEILRHLLAGEKNVGELMALLGGLPQGRVSTHLT